MSRFTGETTQRFKDYHKREIGGIKVNIFNSVYESYAEDLVLLEFYLETGLSPFVGDHQRFHVEKFKVKLLQELKRINMQWNVSRN